MEFVNPDLKPKWRSNFVEKDVEYYTVGSSTYKLVYSGKLSLMCPKHYGGTMAKVGRYVDGFASSEGFMLSRCNDQSAECESASSKPTGLGTVKSSPARKRLVALNKEMAAALFNPAYVESLRRVLDEANEKSREARSNPLAGAEEFTAVKPALTVRPPLEKVKLGQKTLGKLVVGTAISNYNQVRHAFSEDDELIYDDGDGPQMLGQIIMMDSSHSSDSAPVMQFPCSASELIDVLGCKPFQDMIRERVGDLAPDGGRRRGEAMDSQEQSD